MSGNEIDRLDKIAGFYHSAEATEAVDQFHLYLRDITIPRDGGRSALELGCGSGRWTQVLCERYQEVDVVDAADELVEEVVHAFKDKGAVIRRACESDRGVSGITVSYLAACVSDDVARACGRSH